MRTIWLALPAVLVIGWLDFMTGPDIGLSLLYLLPIAITAWRGRAADGIVVALAAAACWTGADAAAGVAIAFSLWNGFTRVVIYTATAFLMHQVREDRNQLQTVNQQLEAALRRESELARTDAVTGLANSRAFLEQLDKELARAGREERSLTLLYLDLDGFKSVNDLYGHDTGDAVLRKVAGSIQSSIRGGDVAARLGGDEFAALLWGTGKAAAGEVAVRITDGIRDLASAYPAAALGVSIGIAQAHGQSMTAAELLREADVSMYERKRSLTPANEPLPQATRRELPR